VEREIRKNQGERTNKRRTVMKGKGEKVEAENEVGNQRARKGERVEARAVQNFKQTK